MTGKKKRGIGIGAKSFKNLNAQNFEDQSLDKDAFMSLGARINDNVDHLQKQNISHRKNSSIDDSSKF